jgi:hypothetical protein
MSRAPRNDTARRLHSFVRPRPINATLVRTQSMTQILKIKYCFERIGCIAVFAVGSVQYCVPAKHWHLFAVVKVSPKCLDHKRAETLLKREPLERIDSRY